jgi:hypothetical protein
MDPIWFSLIIPITLLIIFFVWKGNELTIWESIIPIFIAIGVILLFQTWGRRSLVNDTEYWGNYVTSVEYYEPWDEWITKTCTRSYACGSDVKGNTTYCTETYDCSYREYHSAEYYIILNDGMKHAISANNYSYYVKLYNVKQVFTDLHRDYYTEDWPGTYETFDFYASKHTYTNKVQCSQSVFNYPKVNEQDKKQYKLFDYPKLSSTSLDAVLGDSNIRISNTNLKIIQKKFNWINGMLGKKKQVRVWVLVWLNADDNTGYMQEAYWKGGNMNEYIICLSVDKKNIIQWSKVISWTEVYDLPIETRNYFAVHDTLNLIKFADWLYPKLDKKWIRRNFSKFDYLSVPVPFWALLSTYIISLIVSLIFYYWAVTNEFVSYISGKVKINFNFLKRRN